MSTYWRRLAVAISLPLATLVLMGGHVSSADASSANQVCQTVTGYNSAQLTGCVTSGPTGLTFSWSGYVSSDYMSAGAQIISYGTVGGTQTQQDVCYPIPPGVSTCSVFVPLAPGTYTGTSTIGTGNVPSPQFSFTLSVVAIVVGMASTTDGQGYLTVTSSGQVQAKGDAVFEGDLSGATLNQPIVGITPTPDNKGYWLDAADGGIFAFGDAQFHGSMGGHPLNQPMVGMAATPDGRGYWEVASDGGIFAFGDAQFHGSMGGHPLNQPVDGIAVDNATGGYWMVAADGGIFAFDAPFHGSTGNLHLNQPIIEMEAAPDGSGYRFVARDGGIFCFNLPFEGSLGSSPPPDPVAGMAASGNNGYWLVDQGGNVWSFGGAPSNL